MSSPSIRVIRQGKVTPPSEPLSLIATAVLTDSSHQWIATDLQADGLILLEDDAQTIGFVGTYQQIKAAAGGILIALDSIAPEGKTA